VGKTVVTILAVVVAVAIAVAAPYLGAALAAAIGVTSSVGIALVTAGVTLALSLGASLAFRALGVGKPPSAKDQIGPPGVFRQTISNSFIIYGKRRVGGLLVFFHPRQSGSDHYRYFVVACAGHRCKGVVSWMLGDEIVTVDGSNMVTSGPFAGAAWLWFQRGLASETANATFISECGGKWTSNHKGNGIAAIYAKFKMTDAVVQAGMPNITAVIEGRDEILDTRDATLKYTRNAALIFYDWMSIPREEGGFGAYSDEIPDDSWINAQANVCDETVDSEERYALDVFMTTGAAPSEVRDALIVNQAGSYAYRSGKHLMRPGYWVPVSVNLSEDDLAGPIQVSSFMSADNAANEVQGTFVSPDDNYQAKSFTTQSVAGSDVRQLDLDLAFITSLNRSNRIARIMMLRAQAEKTVVWPMNIMGLGTGALDTVQCGSSRYGLDNYAFQVANWQLSADYGTILQLREENEEIYAAPSPVSPTAPPTIDPVTPIDSSVDIQNLIVTSAMSGLTFDVGIPAGGNSAVTISNHDRVYSDKTVSVIGNGGSVSVAAAAGDLMIAYYDDPARAGGAATYQYLVLAGGAGDASPAYASPTNPYRHTVFAKIVPTTGGSTGGGSDPGSGGGSGGGGRWEDTGSL
jgi:hypothetical protein